MGSLFESEVYAARNHTPWAAIKLAELMRDLATEGSDVKLECAARPSVASRFWWTLSWTTEDGRRWLVDAQTLDLCLWRAAVREQKTRTEIEQARRPAPPANPPILRD
jgi:hypothetical protein